jgi:putative phosphoesterase
LKVGVVSDIHSNLAAFFIVILTFRQENVDLILNLGDSVGYYSKPREVLALLKELKENDKLISVMGNHDIAVSGFIFHDLFSADYVTSLGEALIKSQNYNAQESWSWTISQLDKDLTKTLLDDTSKTVEVDGVRIHMVHGAPYAMRGEFKDEVGFYLTADKVEKHKEQLSKFFEDEKIDIMINGHTHFPLHMKVGNTHVLNPGSVGQSRDGDPRTSFLIMDLEEGKVRNIKFYRQEYTTKDALMAKFESSDEDKSLFQIFDVET